MKRFFIAFTLLGISFLGFSQNQFGLKAGATLGYFDNEGKEYDFGDPKLGFAVGYIGRFTLSNKFFIKSELGFSQINSSLIVPETYLRIDRIDLIFLSGYRIFNKLDIEIGSGISYLIKNTYKSRNGKGSLDFNRKVNLGLNVGSNFRINNHLGINLKYSLGLLYYNEIQIIDENQNDAGTIKSERVSYLSLGVNYYFNN